MSQNFGEYLRDLRGKLSLREAAERIGISHTYIRDLELEKKMDPSRKTLEKIAKAYDHSYFELLEKVGYLRNPETSEEMEDFFKSYKDNDYHDEHFFTELDNILGLPQLTYKTYVVTVKDRELIKMYLDTLFYERIKED